MKMWKNELKEMKVRLTSVNVCTVQGTNDEVVGMRKKCVNVWCVGETRCRVGHAKWINS